VGLCDGARNRVGLDRISAAEFQERIAIVRMKRRAVAKAHLGAEPRMGADPPARRRVDDLPAGGLLDAVRIQARRAIRRKVDGIGEQDGPLAVVLHLPVIVGCSERVGRVTLERRPFR
jgi:hypothetical protein